MYATMRSTSTSTARMLATPAEPAGGSADGTGLAAVAGGSFIFSLVLYLVYRILLNGGIADLQTLASQLIG